MKVIIMGWRNLFFKVNCISDIEEFNKFMNEHNNYPWYDTDITNGIDKLERGEDIEDYSFIKNPETNQYYIYTGVYGGVGYVMEFCEIKYPHLKLLDSYSFESGDWNEWPYFKQNEIDIQNLFK